MTEITNRKEYNWAVNRVEELLRAIDRAENNTFTDAESPFMVEDEAASYNVNVENLEIELKLLSDLVSDYSEKHYSIGKPTLAEVIQLRMYEMGLTQKAVADLLGISPARVSEYLNGKSEPTLQIAREISIKLNIDPSIVLGV